MKDRQFQGLISLVLMAGITAIMSGDLRGADKKRGQAIYQKQCAECHGQQGEGVADKHDEPLYGNRSLNSLARLIERTMPEEDPKQCVGDDALAVAAFVYDAFYSQEARARINPPRIDPSRLTIRQYRESFADLIASFLRDEPPGKPAGLDAEYYQSKGMNKKQQQVKKRVDEKIDYDFGTNSPMEGITADQFSIAWSGSLIAPDTGNYEFRIRTPNGARLYLNTDMRRGDSNRRDDSDAKRQSTLIDLWVSSGAKMREATATKFLLGGRQYPIRLDYFKFKEKHASIRLEWKPPHGVWTVLSAEHLSPKIAQAVGVIETAFPPDDGSLGYERGAAISKGWHDATTRAAVEGANEVVARLSLLSQSSRRDPDPDRAAKLKTFAQRFAERAFRRPLTEELQQVYVDRHFTGDLPPETAVKRVALLVLKSPRFLYPEMGGETDDYTVAARLALNLWDSLPDQTLRNAAADGQLRTPQQVREQAHRMVFDERTRTKLGGFFDHWLALDEAEDLAKDKDAYPGFDEGVIADLRHSLQTFVEETVWKGRSDYRELLLSDSIYLNKRLAEFYGADELKKDAFVKVAFDPAQRAGIFTHPYLLSAFSYHKSTSPIHRGVFLTRNVLGRFLKPPPMAIEFMDDKFDDTLTMREKVTELTKKTTCMACHATINPLGFSLEHYDAVGRYRTTDNDKPVNAESDYTTVDGDVIRLTGARDLARHAASSREARLGFIRQMFQHTVKQAPAAYGAETLRQLDSQFTASEFHMKNLLLEIVVTAAAHDLKTPQTGETSE